MASRTARMAAYPVATFLGLGYAPVAPGTAGSLGALLAAALLAKYQAWRPWHFGLLAAVSLLPGIWAASVVERESGRPDPSKIVVDEAIGQWVTLAGATALVWQSWLAALALFRLFDIWKPFPARRAEALPGGLGIIADDLVAGFYGALVLFAAGCFNLY